MAEQQAVFNPEVGELIQNIAWALSGAGAALSERQKGHDRRLHLGCRIKCLLSLHICTGDLVVIFVQQMTALWVCTHCCCAGCAMDTAQAHNRRLPSRLPLPWSHG